MKKLFFVFNPRSGKSQIRDKLVEILDLFVKAGYDPTVHVTQCQGDARRQVMERGEEFDLIVCSGGDGTLNETISGIMGLARRPVMGYIPAGSTNDFAASLGMPKQMVKAAQIAVSGEEFGIDVGYFCREAYFVYVAAFGAFTEVSYMTTQEAKNMLGHQAYMLEAVKRLSLLKSYPMRVEWEDRILEEEFILGMVTNTISVGGFRGLVSREVALDDGEFEVLLVRTPKKPKDLQSIVTYLLLREGENECVYTFRAKSIRMKSEENIDWSLDGEYGGGHREVEVENLCRAVQIKKKAQSTELC